MKGSLIPWHLCLVFLCLECSLKSFFSSVYLVSKGILPGQRTGVFGTGLQRHCNQSLSDCRVCVCVHALQLSLAYPSKNKVSLGH